MVTHNAKTMLPEISTGAHKRFKWLDKHNRKAALIATALLERVAVRAGQTYLDVGCGSGGATRYVAEQLHLIATGVDIGSEEINEAQDNSGGESNVKFQIANAEHLPFENSSFDFIFCCKALHHIPAWQVAIQEMIRVLKPQGYLLVSDLLLPYCWTFIKDRMKGSLGPFPNKSYIQAAAIQAGLQQKFLKKRIGDYDIMWQKLV